MEAFVVTMFDDLSQEEMAAFEVLATKLELAAEVRRVREEIETLRVREEIEEVNLSKEVETLEVRLETLEEELEDIRKTPDPEVLKSRAEVKTSEERLAKLQQKKDQISESVYQRLQKEYTTKLAASQEELDEEEKRIRRYHHEAKELVDRHDEYVEELHVRASLGDLTEEELAQKVQEAEINVQQAKVIHSATKILIDQINKEHGR